MTWAAQLVSWVKFGGQQIGYYVRFVIHEMVKFTFTLWGVFLIIAGLVYTALQDTVGAIQQLGELIGGIDFTNHPGVSGVGGGIAYIFAFANTFTPLDELLSYGASYLVIMGSLGVYRLIKSWIPTVGGG